MSLEKRTKKFSLAAIRLFESLLKSPAGQIIGKQMLRSATSVGAQYQEARRARSKAEFAAKIGGSIQELAETIYWFELIEEANLASGDIVKVLRQEANQLMAMFVASSNTVKAGSSC